MNKHKRYCFEAEEKKFKKIIAHNMGLAQFARPHKPTLRKLRQARNRYLKIFGKHLVVFDASHTAVNGGG